METGTKCVLIVRDDLPIGLVANTAAVLALTLGKRVEGVLGPDVVDGSQQTHAGITSIPIPVLKAAGDELRSIKARADSDPGLFVVAFTNAAQTTATYADYTTKIGATPADELAYLGVALHGDKKSVSRLTGKLPLLR